VTTRVEKTIIVNVPVSTAYNQWTQFEEFPQFMGGVQQVEQLDDQRLRWVAEMAGVKREWYARVTEQRPDEKVAWAATEGATNAGAVYFTPAGTSGTTVTLELEYEPEGLVEKAGDALNIVGRQAEADLEKFKSFIEGRNTETGAWRGEVEGTTFGTPGVESATSQGDSGKAGISGKAVAAGVAAAAAGVAAVAASRSGSDETQTTTSSTVSGQQTTEATGPMTPLMASEQEEVITYTDTPSAAGVTGSDSDRLQDTDPVVDVATTDLPPTPPDERRMSGGTT